MKRSKILIGVTTGFLVIAALAAKKAAYTQIQKAYTCVVSGQFATRQYNHIGNTKFESGASRLGFTNVTGNASKLCTDAVWTND